MSEKKNMIQAPKSPLPQKPVASPIDTAMQSFGALIPKLKSTLPPHITPERFLSVTRIAILKNPRLLDLDRQSLVNAALECSADGLVPDGREAAFVEFKGKVKHMPMTYGLIKKIKQSGEITSMDAQVIHKNDPFRYWVDNDGTHVLFEPDFFGDRGEPIGVFAFAKSRDGDLQVEPMTRQQVMDVKNVSPASKSEYSPWNGDFEGEMWRKSAIRRMAKKLPMNNEVQQVMNRDEEIFSMENKPKTRAEELREKLAAQKNQPLIMSAEDLSAADSIEVESSPVVVQSSDDPAAFANFDGAGK